jgi:ubiquinone/menaquinone biosynthesis C-methylase UbiE
MPLIKGKPPAEEITSKVYDDHILDQGLQFQIDTYYEPKDAFSKKRIEDVLAAVNPLPGERILDIGCGVGTFAFHCAKRGALTAGIDYSEESIRAAKTLSSRFGVGVRTDFRVGNALELPFEDSSFDKVVAADFIEHITHEEKVIFCNEMFRVLKPGGTAVVFTPNNIRESIGTLYWTIRHYLFKDAIPSNRLHYGLISRSAFEKILSRHPVSFTFRYIDSERPYFTALPLLNNIFSLNLLWTIRKEG